MSNNDQANIHRLDSLDSVQELVKCTTCGKKHSKSEVINIGFIESFCLKCFENGFVTEYIIANESPVDVESVLFKLEVEAYKLKSAN